MKLCTIFICIAVSAFMLLSAQQVEDKQMTLSPSEETFQEIETVTKPSIRYMPGDFVEGDDFGQRETPLGNIECVVLVILGIALSGYVLIKRKIKN